jgi:hypothetical protein
VAFLARTLLILYFVNLGREFTKALYINRDHSMLTYPLYKRPGRILEMFRLRLWEIAKINLLPSSVPGLGTLALMAVYDPQRALGDYAPAFASIMMMGMLFSVQPGAVLRAPAVHPGS